MAGVAAVIVAAGRGSRAGGDLPKQFRPIGGEPMLRVSADHVCPPSRDRHGTAGHPSRRRTRSTGPSFVPRSVHHRRYSAAPPGKPRCVPASSVRPGKPDIVPGPRRGAARSFRPALVSRAIAAAKVRQPQRYRRSRSPTRSRPSMPPDTSPRRSRAPGCAWSRRHRLSPSQPARGPSQAVAAASADFTDDAALAEWPALK